VREIGVETIDQARSHARKPIAEKLAGDLTRLTLAARQVSRQRPHILAANIGKRKGCGASVREGLAHLRLTGTASRDILTHTSRQERGSLTVNRPREHGAGQRGKRLGEQCATNRKNAPNTRASSGAGTDIAQHAYWIGALSIRSSAYASNNAARRRARTHLTQKARPGIGCRAGIGKERSCCRSDWSRSPKRIDADKRSRWRHRARHGRNGVQNRVRGGEIRFLTPLLREIVLITLAERTVRAKQSLHRRPPRRRHGIGKPQRRILGRSVGHPLQDIGRIDSKPLGQRNRPRRDTGWRPSRRVKGKPRRQAGHYIGTQWPPRKTTLAPPGPVAVWPSWNCWGC